VPCCRATARCAVPSLLAQPLRRRSGLISVVASCNGWFDFGEGFGGYGKQQTRI
jgi:hypothetical protein